MVVKVTANLKDLIIPNASKLKGKTNQEGFSFFINQQIPDALAAEKKAIQYKIKRVKDFNEALPPGHKKKQFEIKNKKLYVDNKLHAQSINPPTPLDIFVGKMEQQKIDEIDLVVSKPKSLNSSQFIGLAAKANTMEDVTRAYKKARQLYPSYDHIIMAYNILGSSGYQDDGEHAAGIKLHSKIFESKCLSVILMVARNFGGVHMGPARFECMDLVAAQALTALIKEHPEIELNSAEAQEETRAQSQRILDLINQPVPGPSNSAPSVNDRLLAIARENPIESP